MLKLGSSWKKSKRIGKGINNEIGCIDKYKLKHILFILKMMKRQFEIIQQDA